MRTAKRLVLAAALGAAVSATAVGQNAGGNGGTGGNANQGGSGGVGSNTNNQENFTDLVTVPLVSGITSTTRGSSVVNSSNPFAAYYWNPMTLGISGANNTSGASGFGVSTMGTTTGGGGGRGSGSASVGTAGGGRSTTSGNTSSFGSSIGGLGNTGLTGATGYGGGGAAGGGFGSSASSGGFGGAAGRGGIGGGIGGMGGVGGRNALGTNGQAAVVASANRDTATIYHTGSPGPAVTGPIVAGAPPAMQIELRTMFDNSPIFSPNKSIQVAATHEGLVTLTGTVASEEEKRLIEGMTKITAGVRKVDSKLVVKNGG